MMDYTGNGGTGAATVPPAATPGRSNRPDLLGSNKKRRILDIKDGASNTLLIGREVPHRRRRQASGSTCNDDQGYVDGWDNAPSATPTATTQRQRYWHHSIVPQWINLATTGGTCGHYFGSSHTNGCMVVFVDGSVHSINYTINASPGSACAASTTARFLDMADVN